MNAKTMSILGGMAVVSAVLYVSVVLHVEPLHAATPMIFSNVIIEDGAMRPLAVGLPSVDVKVDKTEVKTNTNASVNANVNARAAATSSAGTNAGMSGSVVSSTTITAETEEDVEAAVEILQTEDENFRGADIESDEIAVKYRVPARFLGLIPMMVVVTAEVTENGEVELDYPWYAFAPREERDALKTNLGAQISEVVSSGSHATTTASITELTPKERVELIKAIHTSFKAQATSTSSL